MAHVLPDSPVETVGAEAMSTLGLVGPAEDVVTTVAEVLVFQLVGQDLPGEAWLVVLHRRGGGGFLRGHSVCSHLTPARVGVVEEVILSREKCSTSNVLLFSIKKELCAQMNG